MIGDQTIFFYKRNSQVRNVVRSECAPNQITAYLLGKLFFFLKPTRAGLFAFGHHPNKRNAARNVNRIHFFNLMRPASKGRWLLSFSLELKWRSASNLEVRADMREGSGEPMGPVLRALVLPGQTRRTPPCLCPVPRPHSAPSHVHLHLGDRRTNRTGHSSHVSALGKPPAEFILHAKTGTREMGLNQKGGKCGAYPRTFYRQKQHSRGQEKGCE